MSNEMVERVAIALSINLRQQFNGSPAPGLPESPDCWTAEAGTIDLSRMARAAIEAMMEPTEEMVRAGEMAFNAWTSAKGDGSKPEHETVEGAVFAAMLQAALKEGE